MRVKAATDFVGWIAYLAVIGGGWPAREFLLAPLRPSPPPPPFVLARVPGGRAMRRRRRTPGHAVVRPLARAA